MRMLSVMSNKVQLPIMETQTLLIPLLPLSSSSMLSNSQMASSSVPVSCLPQLGS